MPRLLSGGVVNDFNVEELQRVYFANPAGIENIISRVTGTNPSSILGTLGVDGAANLFLLNPHGIIFGANAQLDIQGSFVASTANSITFGDGSSFSANPDNSSLLTVSVPLGLQYGTNQAGAIANAGNLAVGSGQTLSLSGGTVTSTGSLTAAGGLVEVLGNQVSLLENARIDVSSDTGGGTVLIGGDFQGNGTVPNAALTFVGSDVTINADALINGDGGKVIVWADQTARVHGTLTARGGTVSGDGGFIETSGKQFLNLTTTPDASAPNGSGGTWLIDPTDITLANGGGAIGTNTVDVANINAALNRGTNVTISTTIGGTDQGNITQENDAPIRKTAGGDATLTLQAENDIVLNADITSNSGQLNVELLADSDNSGAGAIGIFNATIDTNGGDFIGSGKGSQARKVGIFIGSSRINAEDGSINLVGRGRDGSNNTKNHGITLGQSRLETSGLGNITLIGNGGTEGNFSIGINVIENTTVSSENGDIRLIGTGSGVNHGWGIQVRDGSVVRSTGTGNISLRGTSNGTSAGNNYGIIIREQKFIGSPGVVEATGTGSITLEGTGSNGRKQNRGILIQASGRVSAKTGNITLTGTGNGTGSNTGILINSGGVVETTNGTIDLEGFSGSGANFNHGILLQDEKSRISSINGDIILTGGSNAGQTPAVTTNHGIFIGLDGVVQSSGNITLTGTTNANGVDGDGISIQTRSIVEATKTGNITLTGTAGAGSDDHQGIAVGSNAKVSSVDGNIRLLGNSNGTGKNNSGIFIFQNGLLETTGVGSITLQGTGSGTGSNNNGILLSDSNLGANPTSGGVIQSTGTGAITLEGTSAAGTSENQGILIDGNGSRVSGKDGNITLRGTAAPSNGDFNHGIYIYNQGLVQSTGAGSIEITGTANASSNVGSGNEGISIVADGGVESTGTGMITMTGNGGNGGIGSDGDQGIVVLGSNTRVTSVDGDILLKGISRGTGTENYGIWLGAVGGGVVRTTGTGNITLEGIISGIGNNSEGIFFGDGGAIEAIGSGNITLTADEITIPSNLAEITGTNRLQLQPLDPTLGITIGGTTTDARLNLDSSELNTLQKGFAQILIGRDNSSGAIAILPAAFNSPTTIQTPVTGGTITTTGTINTNNNPLTFIAGSDVTFNNDINTGSGNLSVLGSTITQTSGSLFVNGDAFFTSTLANAGNVSVTNTKPTTVGYSIIGGNFTLNSALPITQVPGEPLQVAGEISVNGGGSQPLINTIGDFSQETLLPNGDLIITQLGTVNLEAHTVTGNLTVNSLPAAVVSFNQVLDNPAITLNQDNSFGGTLRFNTTTDAILLEGTPGIIQTGTQTVSGTATFNANTGNISLNEPANQFGNLAFTGNDVSIRESDQTNLISSSATGNLNLTSGGMITQDIGASLTVVGDTSLTTTLPNAGNVTITNSNATIIGNSLIGGDFTINSTGPIFQAPGEILQVAGNTIPNAPSDNLEPTGNNILPRITLPNGDVIITDVGQITLNAETISGNLTVNSLGRRLTFNNNEAFNQSTAIELAQSGNSFGGVLRINTEAPLSRLDTGTPEIIQNGSLNVSGTANFKAENGNITLNNLDNQFGNLSFTGGNISINESDSTNLLNSTYAGNVTITSGGAIAQSGSLSIGESSNQEISLILNAIGDINTQDIISPSGSITLNSTNGSIDTTAGLLSTYSSGSGGPITLSADGDLNLGSLDSGGRDVAGGDITLNSNGAIIAKNQLITTDTDGSGKAGDINIKAQSVSFTGTKVSTRTRGDGSGGNLNINASDSINIINGSRLLVQTYGNGNAGNATINTKQLVVQNDRPELNRSTGIGTETFSSGNGGKLTINASESVKLRGNQSIVFNPNPLDPDSILQAVETATGLTTATFGTGDAGNLSLTTRSLVIQNGAGIISGPVLSDENDAQGTLPEGTGGELNITATESIEIQGQAGIATATLGNGDAGNLFLKSGRITVEEGGTISVDTIIGPVATSINASGNAGNIYITTNQLMVRSGSRIGAATANAGKGGNITINASEFIEVTGLSKDGEVPSTISTEVLKGATESAGDVTITTSNLTVTDIGQISAQSQGEGDAGNININVSDRLTATDGNIITATTQSAGGEIKIIAKDIRLRGDSDITTSVFSGADNGGNITITTDSLIAFADSDILAFARDGRGGNITFTTPIFFGFAFRPAPPGTDPATLDNNNRVDINASAAIPGDIQGLPNLAHITNSLTELPDNLIDTDNLLANSCIVRTSEQEGKFIITGGGNLPTRPGDASVSRYPTGEVRTVPSQSASRPWQKGDPIVEATGVYQLPNGRLVMGRECS
ncbi:filamentous hemagglutinin N-terminal domain-containing protein [Moorena producens JHB]|uniref:Filamentous hemagglutinin N-terminal domain-containing protein n=1 Tax=Moorena producens (strain JHB) TaxID=1454205 RepID=A0A1D9FUN4_MOOP1|nr:filamentous hemagglutinin N-terminal domain-containing protein [Moorena producens]AOY79057.2 filamentous hemagglutinin N-terminal domain-containing protein [Moorena producens JHB]